MTKQELDRLVFWFQEREELTKFRDHLNYCKEAHLFVKDTRIWSVLVHSFTSDWKKEYTLTEIQRIKLWAFLDAEIRHLNGLINSADAEDREIAESVFKGNVGKVALGFKEHTDGKGNN